MTTEASTETTPDRRAHRRAPLPAPVMIDTAAESRPFPARNVSGSGLAVAADMVLELGRIVDVYFELPIGVAIEAKAEVVRAADGVLGLRFLDLEHDEEVALRSYCRISGLHRVTRQ